MLFAVDGDDDRVITFDPDSPDARACSRAYSNYNGYDIPAVRGKKVNDREQKYRRAHGMRWDAAKVTQANSKTILAELYTRRYPITRITRARNSSVTHTYPVHRIKSARACERARGRKEAVRHRAIAIQRLLSSARAVLRSR